MNITPNNLIKPTNKIIKPYSCAMISTEGPNVIGKINLNNLEIKYDSQYTSKLILNANSKNQPLLYGFLGSEITFLLIKVSYDKTNPYCDLASENYLEYYLADDKELIRYIGDYMVLTGSNLHRIPQIYLNNPTEYKVIIDVMMANLDQPDLTESEIDDNKIITNLYHRNIISDQIMFGNYTGSTQLEILDLTDNLQLVIPYDQIHSINIDELKFRLIINTNNEQDIILEFLSQWEMYQANSRINWVIENYNYEHLTKNYPTPDTDAPIIVENSIISPILPIVRDINNNFNITKEQLIDLYIDSISDIRDGIILKYDLTTKIFKNGSIVNLESITEPGIYDISFSITDIANNRASISYNVIANDIAPVITFKPNITNMFSMNIPDDVLNTNSGLTKNDIIRYSILSVNDSLDGVISNSNVQITINQTSGVTGLTSITELGNYDIIFKVVNSALVQTIITKELTIYGGTIIHPNTVFNFNNLVNTAALIFTGGSGTTAIVDISGNSFVVGNVSGDFVWDIGGIDEHIFTTINESIFITINGFVYSVVFNGFGSLIFTIHRLEEAPLLNYTNLQYDYISLSGNSYQLSSTTVSEFNQFEFDGDIDSEYIISLSSVSLNRNLKSELFGLYLDSSDLLDMNYLTLDEYYQTKTGVSYLSGITSKIVPFVYLSGYEVDLIDSYENDINNNQIALKLSGDFPKGEYVISGKYYDSNDYSNLLTIKIKII